MIQIACDAVALNAFLVFIQDPLRMRRTEAGTAHGDNLVFCLMTACTEDQVVLRSIDVQQASRAGIIHAAVLGKNIYGIDDRF